VKNLRRPGSLRAAGWLASYRFEDDPDVGEGPCRLLDVSSDGAGIEAFGDTPVNPVGHRLSIDVRGGSEGAISVRLAGSVRAVSLGPSGGVRLGIEYAAMTALDREIVDALQQVVTAG
jgi:hypothetical protein